MTPMFLADPSADSVRAYDGPVRAYGVDETFKETHGLLSFPGKVLFTDPKQRVLQLEVPDSLFSSPYHLRRLVVDGSLVRSLRNADIAPGDFIVPVMDEEVELGCEHYIPPKTKEKLESGISRGRVAVVQYVGCYKSPAQALASYAAAWQETEQILREIDGSAGKKIANLEMKIRALKVAAESKRQAVTRPDLAEHLFLRAKE